MSLAVLADHLASKGRNGDTMLVHMTPEEVHGLHALALAHGGQLTINPETGLPEANFLKKMLPMIAGMALNFIAPGVGTAIGGMLGVSGAVGTGIAVGGLTGLATGSLKQGIMAGLGAYGGAGLAEGLIGASSAGASTAAAEAAKAASEQLVRDNAMAASVGADLVTGSAADKFVQDAASKAYSNFAAQPLMAQAKGSFGALKDAGGLSSLLRPAMAAAAPVVADAMVPTTTAMPTGQRYQGTIRPYRFDPYTRTWTAQPTYPAVPVNTAAEPNPQEQQPPGGYRGGGIVALANGGTPPGMTGSIAEQNVLNTKGWQSRSGLTGIEGLNSNINMWFNEFPQARESDIRSAMQQYGLNDADIMRATGKSVGDLAYKPPTVTPVDPSKPAIISSTTPTGYDYSAAQLQNDRQRQINDIYNRVLNRQAEQGGLDYWANSGLSIPEIESQIQKIAGDIGVAAPKPIAAGPSTPGTQGPSATFGGDTVTPGYTAPQPQVTLGEPFKPTAQTMEQVRTGYEQGGGSTRMPTITDIKPGERTYTLNAVADMITGFLQQNPNAKYSEVQQFAQSKGIPEMQARAAYNEFRFSTMTGGTKNAYDYLMGRAPYSVKPFIPGGGPVARPYAEAMGLTDSAMSRFRPTMPPSGGTTDKSTTTTTSTTKTTTPSVDTLRKSFDQSIFGKTPEEKAAYYNTLLGQGYTDEQIRAAINAPLDDNWLALRAIAERLRAGTTKTTGGGSVTSGTTDTTGETRSTAGGTTLTSSGVNTLLGNAGTGSASTTSNTSTSTTPITDFLFGTQDADAVPVEDRSTYSNAAVDERINDFLSDLDRSFYYDYAAPSRSFDDTSPFARGGLADVAAMSAARGGNVQGYNLGGYSDGGRLLRGPGDGVSDSIPATIGNKQPARLADGEFVIPARIVSEIGNGSTEAGARKLYKMMDRVQRARAKTTGKGKVAKNTRAEKYLPA